MPFWLKLYPAIYVWGVDKIFPHPPLPKDKMPVNEAEITTPNACPQIYQAEVDKLHADARLQLEANRVPYSIQAELAKQDYLSLSDLAFYWKTSDDARDNAPKDLGFKHDINNNTFKFTEQVERRSAMRLSMAVMNAQNLLKPSPTLGGQGSHGMAQSGVSTLLKGELAPGTRDTLVAIYKQKCGEDLPMDRMPSEQLLSKFLEATKKGEILSIELKKLVPYIPDPASPIKKQLVNGYEEQETLKSPQTMETWKQQVMLYRDSLLMCTWNHSQFKQFDLSKQDLDAFYEHLHGRDLAAATPSPPLHILMRAERRAWREVAFELHKCKSLRQALLQVQNNYLFWIREVITPTKEYFEKDLSKGKGNPRGLKRPWPTGGSTPRGQEAPRLKGTSKGSKSKDKGKKSKDKPNAKVEWSKMNPKQTQEYCFNYQRGTCKDQNCAKSHRCPVKKGHWICNGEHLAKDCPMAK